jgi:hypothetical protein
MRPPVEDPVLCHQWFEQLWLDACALRGRYLLPIRRGWWANPLQVEALAALAAWVERYDSEVWDDPPGKLALLYDLERVSSLLREGAEPFYPDRDRAEFTLYLDAIGCTEPAAPQPAPGPQQATQPHPRRYEDGAHAAH